MSSFPSVLGALSGVGHGPGLAISCLGMKRKTGQKSRKNSRRIPGFLGALAFASLAALSLGGVSSFAANPARADAEKIFAYDRAHPARLPAHLLRALSLAIAFYDDEGARKLIQVLQRSEREALR